MHWVYLSPHFDDIALSCGGLVWEQSQAGDQVEIWTICAGQPRPDERLSAFAQALHDRWQTGPEAVLARRQEDEDAGRLMGAKLRFWDLPDCIYRLLPDGTYLVNGEDDLWQPAHAQESGVVQRMQAWMAAGLRPDTQLVSPMTLGGHVDHRLVRAAAEEMNCPVWYYADFPYVLQHPEALEAALQPEWQQECFSVSPEALAAWQQAISQYTSQISTFWGGLASMRTELETYWRSGGGTCLWRKPGVRAV